jgi:hypothetical protein
VARDPNEIKTPGIWDNADDFPPSLTLPDGITKGDLGKQFYAQYKVYANGRRVIEWYKRGTGDGKTDPVFTTTEDVVPAVKEAWDKEEAKGDQEGDIRPSSGPKREVFRGGKWVVEDNPVYQPPASAGNAKPVGGTTQIEGTPLPDGGFDNERPVMVTRDATGKVVSSEPLTPAEMKDWRESRERSRNPGGKTDADVAAETKAATDKADKEQKDADTTVADVAYTGTGKARQKVTTYKSGRKVTEASPTNATVTSTSYDPATGAKITRYDDGTETREAPKPEDAPGAGAMPEGAPAMSGKLGEAASDLQAFDAWLEPQVRSGKLTAARADQLREQRRKAWDTAIKEQEAVLAAQVTNRGQDITQRGNTLQDLSNRRTNATSIANQTESDFMPLMTKMGPTGGSGSIARAIQEARFNANDFLTMSGANREIPEIAPLPAQAQVNGMMLQGGQTPAMAPGFNPRANAIGAGAVPGIMTPGAPPVPQPDPAAATAAANPVFRPQPMAAPPVSEQARDNRQAMMAPPNPYFLAGASRGHVYDPTASIQAMIADPRYDNNAIRQVVAEDYPGYPIDDLLSSRAA